MPCEFCLKHVRVKPVVESRAEVLARRLGKANLKSLAENVDVKNVIASFVRFQVDSLRLGLAVVFFIANALDYYTTKKGLEAGLREKNPFARAIMRMGWRKYQAFKFVPTAAFAFQALTSEDPYHIWAASLVIGSAMFLIAAVQNTLLIAGRRFGQLGEEF